MLIIQTLPIAHAQHTFPPSPTSKPNAQETKYLDPTLLDEDEFKMEHEHDSGWYLLNVHITAYKETILNCVGPTRMEQLAIQRKAINASAVAVKTLYTNKLRADEEQLEKSEIKPKKPNKPQSTRFSDRIRNLPFSLKKRIAGAFKRKGSLPKKTSPYVSPDEMPKLSQMAAIVKRIDFARKVIGIDTPEILTGHTPLTSTIRYQRIDEMRKLLFFGASPDAKNLRNGGQTPKQIAFRHNFFSIMEELFMHGVSEQTEMIRSILSKREPLSSEQLGALKKLMLRVDNIHEMRSMVGGTILHFLAFLNDADAGYISLLVKDRKVDPNAISHELGMGQEGLTALHVACSTQEETSDFIRILVQQGANPNLLNVLDESPLQYALTNIKIPSIVALLQCGAKIESVRNKELLFLLLKDRLKKLGDIRNAESITIKCALLYMKFALEVKIMPKQKEEDVKEEEELKFDYERDFGSVVDDALALKMMQHTAPQLIEINSRLLNKAAEVGDQETCFRAVPMELQNNTEHYKKEVLNDLRTGQVQKAYNTLRFLQEDGLKWVFDTKENRKLIIRTGIHSTSLLAYDSQKFGKYVRGEENCEIEELSTQSAPVFSGRRSLRAIAEEHEKKNDYEKPLQIIVSDLRSNPSSGHASGISTPIVLSRIATANNSEPNSAKVSSKATTDNSEPNSAKVSRKATADNSEPNSAKTSKPHSPKGSITDDFIYFV